MSEYINPSSPSIIEDPKAEDISGITEIPPSHWEIAQAQPIPSKYRVPYEYEELKDDKVNEIIIDASGNETTIYGSTGWTGLEEGGLMDMFADLNTFKEDTGKVQWDKVDYQVYGEDWYREKYPHFPDEWYTLLVKASEEKFKDLQSGADSGLKVTQGEYVVKFD